MLESNRRLAMVKQGLAFAILPAALFVPVLGYLGVCPNPSAATEERTVLLLFLASEIWALRRLVPSLNTLRDGKADRLNLFVRAGLTIATLTVLASAGLLVIGYPRPW
jgi:hypothetical protein